MIVSSFIILANVTTIINYNRKTFIVLATGFSTFSSIFVFLSNESNLARFDESFKLRLDGGRLLFQPIDTQSNDIKHNNI
jgi:hypothetical protein